MKHEDTLDAVIELGAASVLTEGNGDQGGDGAGQKILGGLSDD
jgi:hypothetical protein